MNYTVIVAGSTAHTRLCAETLLADTRFEIVACLTPTRKKIGRDQTLTKNPLHQFAEKYKLPLHLVDEKLNGQLRKKLLVQERPHFLLVVDFGYYVPGWLLTLPIIAPLNIHPSFLPRWRGSSPGQFVILNGEKESAVTLMIMSKEMDQGPILRQLPLVIDPSWTYKDYYDQAFRLVAAQLADLIGSFAQGQGQAQPQPLESPTPVARRLNREDGFIEYTTLQSAIQSTTPFSASEENRPGDDLPLTLDLYQSTASSLSTPLLSTLLAGVPGHSQPLIIDRAVRGLSPWPGVWTVLPSGKRCKILQTSFDEKTGKLEVVLSQVEGKKPGTNFTSHSERSPSPLLGINSAESKDPFSEKQ